MWIRVDTSAPEHRKTKRLLARLKAMPPVPADDPRVVLGTLTELWLKTRQQAPDGAFDGYTPEDLAGLLEVDVAVVDALIEAGFVQRTDFGLEVVNWEEHNGQHLKEAKKKKAQRAAKRAATPSTGPAPASSLSRPVSSRREDIPGTSRGCPGDTAGDADQRILPLLTAVTGGTGERQPPVQAPGDAERMDLAVREPAPPDAILGVLSRVAAKAQPFGKDIISAAMSVCRWLEGQGLRHPGLLERFGLHYVEHHRTVRNPFAYYNPGAPGHEAIRMRLAAELATADHEAEKRAMAEWELGLRREATS